jgi:arylsulfatase A-like enzyme
MTFKPAMTLKRHSCIIPLLLCALAVLGGFSKASEQSPNILFILADDLGWADLSCYGSTFHETPHLDRLAAQGMRFTEGYAAHSYCSPTRAALLTGRDPARLRITDYIPSNSKTGKFLPAEIHKELPLSEVTLAEILREHGYATWHVGKWHLGGDGFHPEQQGFDINIAGNHSGAPASFFWPYGHDNPKAKKKYHGSPVPGLVDGGHEGEHLCDRLTTEAIRLIEQRDRAKPFFLYLPFYDVHTPIMARRDLIAKYQAKAKALDLPAPDEAERVAEGNPAHGSQRRDDLLRQCNATYAAMVETMDTNVGRILDVLDVSGLAKNTLVIFTSDNGGLNQHDPGRRPVTSNAPLRSGKGWLYEGGVRVPWIVRLPGVTVEASLCEHPIVATDLSPTVLDLCGLPPRPDIHLDGRSFARLLEGGSEPIHDTLFWHFPHYGNTGSGPCSSVRVGDWKLIHWMENDSVELFDLASDPGEQHNLASRQPDRVRDLRARLEARRQTTGARMPRPKP